MRFMRTIGAAVAVMALVAPAGAEAANKEHQQLMAEIRMLQEQQQQLQQMLGGLSDTLKTVTAKLDEQSGVNRKAFADEKLLIDGINDGVRVLREKADDTNVRLSTISQELDTLRQAIASQPPVQAPATAVPTPTGEPGAPVQPATAQPTPGTAPAPLNPPPANVSPQRMYDQAYADFAAGQYDLAVTGFETFIKMFPRHTLADDAQTNIGNSLYNAGQFKDAVVAYQKVISDFPNADTVPEAYYKMGLSYDRLGQTDLARKAFETVIQRFPASASAVLAKQRLDAIKK